MGLSCCACINAEKMMTPRLILDNHHHLEHSVKSKRKFNDIQPMDAEDIHLSQLDLASLNHQLSEFIVQYEIKNGKITKKFTQRMFADEIFNDQTLQKNNQHHHPIIQTKSHPLQKSINQQPYPPNLQLNYQHLNIEQQQLFDNIDISSFSQNNDSLLNGKNKSCLLSLSSRVLNESIFTHRQIEKDKFYRQFNRILGVELEKWTYNDRLSYDLKESQILSFNQICQDDQFTISMASIYYYYINNCLNLLSYNNNPNAIKIYLNGQPKLYPLINTQHVNLQSIYNFINKLNLHQITHLNYLLTGWIPQIIIISQLKQVNEVIERLAANIEQANTLISFSRQNNNQLEYSVLIKVDIENQLIFMNTFNTKTSILPLFLENTDQQCKSSPHLQVISYQNFIQLFDYININWNPFIYQQRINQQGILNTTQSQHKYMVIIPPSSQDLQLRLMFQKHHNFEHQNHEPLIIKLYEYTTDIQSLGQPIRNIIISDIIYSDVFIFEACQEKTSYLLTIGYKQAEKIVQEVTYTASLMSFAQIKFKSYKPRYLLKQCNLLTTISPLNTGYGINSPYFHKNLQFCINTTIGNDIQIVISTKKKLIYEICLIPDANNHKDLSKIKLETIINNSQISNYNKGNGKLLINAQYQSYILIINAYTQINANLDIKLNSYGEETIDETLLSIEAINFNLLVKFNHEIKWLPTHSGPRKRLKSNSINDYQHINTFKEFFNNPSIEKTLTKGKYQFYIKSMTFQQIFDSVETYEEKNSIEPPALSMAIFMASETQKQLYKIILDDAFYVPFGIGFWSSQIQLEQGCYKFVFPKMDKGFGQGNFGIIKC